MADCEKGRDAVRVEQAVRALQLFRNGDARATIGEGEVRRRQGDRAVNGVFRSGVAMVRLEMDENILVSTNYLRGRCEEDRGV
jgi:hypothetical protein